MGHGLRAASRGTSSLELLASSCPWAKPAYIAGESPKAEGLRCLCVKKLSVCTGKVDAKNIWVGHRQHLLHSSTMQNSQYRIDPTSCLLNTNRTLCYSEYLVSALGRTHK